MEANGLGLGFEVGDGGGDCGIDRRRRKGRGGCCIRGLIIPNQKSVSMSKREREREKKN